MTTTAAETRPHTWLRIRAMARRHAYVLRRSPHRLFDLTVWPIVDVLLFGSLGVFVQNAGGTGASAFAYLLSGIVLWHVVYQGQIAVSTGFLEETWSRNLLNLMVSPLRESEYAAGVAIAGLVKVLLGVGATALTAFAFYAFDITNFGFGLIPVFAILLAAGWIIAIFVIGLVLRFGTGAEALAWGILFVMMPLSGTFFPPEALPGFLHPVAAALPTTHAFAATRTLIDTGAIDTRELWLAAVTTAICAVGAILFLKRMLALFRDRGYITRYS